MPGRDRTGPLGRGPASGRGFGPCASGNPRRFRGFAGPGARACWQGYGRGFFRAGESEFSSRQELLMAEEEILEKRLDSVREELAELTEKEK